MHCAVEVINFVTKNVYHSSKKGNFIHVPLAGLRMWPAFFPLKKPSWRYTEQPHLLWKQSQIYSEHISHTTLNGQIGVDPRGSAAFISTLHSGTISDKCIMDQEMSLLVIGHSFVRRYAD